MNLAFPAGAFLRRIRFEPEEWFARIRLILGSPAGGSTEGRADAVAIADAWIAEYGDEAAWHVARRIAELLDWDDHEGAQVWVEVLNVIEERGRARRPSDG
ncbi:MAG TPA: hypothetical protein VMU08_17800 [Rhizomicrobium sp.]|nr:hypothetical protein [Rhizomicrobium sp.]